MGVRRFLIVAKCYNKRGRLLSSATNSYTQTHPLQAHFAALVGEPEKIYLHAEMLALIRAGEHKVHRIVVERYNKKGHPVLAKPCKICAEAIKFFGVKEVIHT